MLNEFYKFIANRICVYFSELSTNNRLQAAESFCLKLDDNETVENVTKALEFLSEERKIKGEYEYTCKDGSLYKTFTLELVNDEVIIAAQTNDMTTDFLCATLRNAANEERKPLLMISANLIDSAKSGSRDLCAFGMPFYENSIIEEIRKLSEESTELSSVDKRILKFELDRRNADIFSDKSSLFEYKDLLAIVSRGSVEKENFSGFRLFELDEKTQSQIFSDADIDKKIKESNELFERIDRDIRFGNVSTDLASDFDDRFINRIEEYAKEDPEKWSTHFTLHEVLLAKEKKKNKKDNPLNIVPYNISVYSDMPLNELQMNQDIFVRSEGSMKTKKRKYNLLIFNKLKDNPLHIKVECNIKIPNHDLKYDNSKVDLSREGNCLIFELIREGISFHKFEIEDSVNNIVYIIKTCIIDIDKDYLIPTIKTSFLIDYKSNIKKSTIKILEVGTELTFNSNRGNCNSEKIEQNGSYQCNYDEALRLYAIEEEFSDYTNDLDLVVNFGGVTVPFKLVFDEQKSTMITGKRILQNKFASKQSFEIDSLQRISKDTQEYFSKENLTKELIMEQQIIDQKILCGHCSDLNYSKNIKIESEELDLDESLKDAYINLLQTYKKYNTVPTLAYLSGEIIEAVKKYLDAFNNLYLGLQEDKHLTTLQANALLLGTLTVGKREKEILLTPFHPLNLAYQLELLNEIDFKNATDVIIDRLSSTCLLPYIERDGKVYKVSDQAYSLEWRYYAPVENKKYRGSRRFVPKLIEEKITEFVSHFKYLFSDINNKNIRINLINMGDCSDVFIGIAKYFINIIKKKPDVDQLMNFEIHIYSDDVKNNMFLNLKEYSRLKEQLQALDLEFERGVTMNSLEGVLSKNIQCFFHTDGIERFEYAHISFYEMESEITSEIATMDDIETGISLGGILSGVPSSNYGGKYRTGFGTKYAKETNLVTIARLFNSLIQVNDTGNPYHAKASISTQIEKNSEKKMDAIYEASSWVVFVDPKVDLDFFYEKEAESDMLIIHYSDQYTSSSGYDAITVTHKSQQYFQVIQDYLNEKAINPNNKDVSKIINLFNAVNGDWLLRLVSSKKSNRESTFSREKISIVAAIKFMLAYLKHPDIIWVPISLEEMLRVSGGAGLSSSEGVLSYKNLGFDKGPTSDDLLFIGLNHVSKDLKVYLYPVEVKTGINDATVISKAIKQVSATAKGLQKSMNPEKDLNKTLLYKVNRNFLMQLLITSSKKMKVYHVDDTQNWDIILDQFRKQLLNEEYEISSNLETYLGKGAILSFKKSIVENETSLVDANINFIELPERNQYDLICLEASEIHKNILSQQNDGFTVFGTKTVVEPVSEFSYNEVEEFETKDETLSVGDFNKLNEVDSDDLFEENVDEVEEESIPVEESTPGMKVLFGIDQSDGSNVYWEPNNTDKLFHTNTGIIGTMGTGKTQFTKSMITQLYREREHNIGADELGILIFDYKGDYNESKADFVEVTKAKILKPYKLPFNPLSVIKSKVFKPILPIHIANAFKDTLTKIYGLGPKQQDALFQCIVGSYHNAGIDEGNPNTWERVAPTFEQVYQTYIDDEDIKKNDSLAAAMNKLHQFQIFESDPNETKSLYDLLKGVVVIDLSGYDSDVQNLVVAITLNLFYSQMQATGSSEFKGIYRQLTKLILVDEADNFMSQGFPSLKKILKEGREFGVGTILSTQFLDHFASTEDDYAKYISSWVVHNVDDLKINDVSFVFKTDAKGIQCQNLYNDIKKLAKHYSIVKSGLGNAMYIRDKAFWELYKEIRETNNQ